jgi:nucleoid DNA-binding protein
MDLPIPHGKTLDRSPAYYITSRIVYTIADALLEERPVSIRGFGSFRITTVPPIRRGCMYFYGDKGNHVSTITVPKKKVIRFIPSPLLREFIQEQESLHE